MVGAKCFGVLSIIPVTVILAIGFFIMVTVTKIEEGALKSFGRILATLLCITALLFFVMGMYIVIVGQCSVINMIGRCSVSAGRTPGGIICEDTRKSRWHKKYNKIHRYRKYQKD